MSAQARLLAKGSFVVTAVIAAVVLLASFYSVAHSTVLRAAESRARGGLVADALGRADKAAASSMVRPVLIRTGRLASAQ